MTEYGRRFSVVNIRSGFYRLSQSNIVYAIFRRQLLLDTDSRGSIITQAQSGFCQLDTETLF